MTRIQTGLAGMIFAFFPASRSSQFEENGNHSPISAFAGSGERSALEYIRNRSSMNMDSPVSSQESNS